MGDSNKISLKPNMYGVSYNKEEDNFILSFAYNENEEIDENLKKEAEIILSSKGFQNYIAALLIRAFVFDSSGNDGYAKGIFEEARQQLDEIVEKIKGVNDSEEDD